jgi:hypothetical protein
MTCFYQRVLRISVSEHGERISWNQGSFYSVIAIIFCQLRVLELLRQLLQDSLEGLMDLLAN